MDDDVLVQRVCSLLGDAGVGEWRPTGPDYAADEVGVHYGAIPAGPDQGIGVAMYYSEDPWPVGVNVRRVQLRLRGARDDVSGADRLAADCFTALQGLARVAGFSLVTRVLVAQLGTDSNNRSERADSYQIILDNPEA